MDGTFEWEDEHQSLWPHTRRTCKVSNRRYARTPTKTKKTQVRDGINLTPIFAQIESFMYRIAKLERQNLEFETRIAQLEAARHAPSGSGGSQ